jgi:hypothetical protein
MSWGWWRLSALGAVALTTGCGGGISFVDSHVTGCNAGRPGWCYSHAEDLVGDSLMSKIDDETAALPKDRATAKKLYAWECRAGNPMGCRAIVEKKLASSPAEVEQYTYLAEYYGMAPRSAEEIRAEKARINKVARDFNAERRAEEERREEESRQNWKQAMGEAGQALSDWSAQVNAKSGSRGDGATAPNVGGAVGGSYAVNPDPCAPCKVFVTKMQTACGANLSDAHARQEKSQSPGCYETTAEMHRCTVDRAPGCSKNPEWSKKEAIRMDRAAAEIRR